MKLLVKYLCNHRIPIPILSNNDLAFGKLEAVSFITEE